MRFFNIDLHIGVIGDIKEILMSLGHEVVDKTLSNHAWVLGREKDDLDVINAANWPEIGPEMADAFYKRYRAELDEYDGFIVTHTPCFAMLYRNWRKPIIVVASTRYEQPFTSDAVRWKQFNNFLVEGHNDGYIIPIANNKYDAAYAQLFTGIPWRVIPSYCAYTGIKYVGNSGKSLYWSNLKNTRLPANIIDKDNLKPGWITRKLNRLPFVTPYRGFSWASIGSYDCIIHIPYNVSVMSIFEQYSAGIPMLFPAYEYMCSLYGRARNSGALSQISFNQVYGLPSGSRLESPGSDPNDYADTPTMMEWVRLADFYDADEMPFLGYFSSAEEMVAMANAADHASTHTKMMEFNLLRRQRIVEAWASVVSDLERSTWR